MTQEGYKTQTVAEEAYDGLEEIRRLKGFRSRLQVVTHLVDEELKKIKPHNQAEHAKKTNTGKALNTSQVSVELVDGENPPYLSGRGFGKFYLEREVSTWDHFF